MHNHRHRGTYIRPCSTHTFLPIHMHIHTKRSIDRKNVGAPAGTCNSNKLVFLSGRDKSFPRSVVNWAFSECGPVCHCWSQDPDTLCAVGGGGGRNKVSTDYPPSENTQAVSARGLLSFVRRSQSEGHHHQWVKPFPVVVVRTHQSLWCVTNILQSALQRNISQ